MSNKPGPVTLSFATQTGVVYANYTKLPGGWGNGKGLDQAARFFCAHTEDGTSSGTTITFRFIVYDAAAGIALAYFDAVGTLTDQVQVASGLYMGTVTFSGTNGGGKDFLDLGGIGPALGGQYGWYVGVSVSSNLTTHNAANPVTLYVGMVSEV